MKLCQGSGMLPRLRRVCALSEGCHSKSDASSTSALLYHPAALIKKKNPTLQPGPPSVTLHLAPLTSVTPPPPQRAPSPIPSQPRWPPSCFFSNQARSYFRASTFCSRDAQPQSVFSFRPQPCHSSLLAWEIPWTEEPGGLQASGSQKSRT